MSAIEHGPRALADKLSVREIEVLRLLTAGHTVKSIAVRLGRSETSINERLRDARRKTGVGSSRELARLLDEQKIWDKIPDLASPPSSAAAPGQPASRGLTRTRGRLAMLIALPIIAAGSLIMAADAPFRVASPQAAQTAAPTAPLTAAAASHGSSLVGRWALDVAGVPAAERPRRVTISFSTTPDAHWTTLVEIVTADGTALHAQSTAALDAAPVPVTGNMPFIDSVSLRQPAPGMLVMALGKDGAPVSTRVYTVSRDRRTLTETIIWAGSAMPKLETNRFRRIG